MPSSVLEVTFLLFDTVALNAVAAVQRVVLERPLLYSLGNKQDCH